MPQTEILRCAQDDTLTPLIGNIIGGVSLVTALNFGQVAADNIRNG